MNLKTHTAYPEINHNAAQGTYAAVIYDGDGVILDSEEGEAADRADATAKGLVFVESVADSYLRTNEEESH